MDKSRGSSSQAVATPHHSAKSSTVPSPFVASSSTAPPSAPQAFKEIVPAPRSIAWNPPSSSQAVATQSGTTPSSFVVPSSTAPPPVPLASKEIIPAQSAAQNLLVGPATKGSDPWQLHYYDPPTCDIIEWVKQFLHCDAASINAFPLHPNFNVKVIEYIDEMIME